MKAIVLPQANPSLNPIFSEIDLPIPQTGEVLVRLKAAAINHHELWLLETEKDLQPYVLGSDGSGVVEAVGQGVTRWKQGDEVIIHPALDWGGDESHYGSEFSILGWGNNGTFAEAIAISQDNVFQKPLHLSWEAAAALPLAGLTAYRALFTKAKLQAGETVLVHGVSGGVAAFAVQFAAAAGAKVIVTSTQNSKLLRAKELGAAIALNSKEPGWDQRIKEQLEAGSLDLVIDSLGGELIPPSLGLLRNGGRLVSYGWAANQFSTIDMQDLFWRQLTIIGSTMGSPKDFRDMLEFVSRHKIHPVIDSTFSFEKISEAFARQNNSDRFGKIAVRIAQ